MLSRFLITEPCADHLTGQMQSVPPLDENCGIIVRSHEHAYDHLIKIIRNARTELLAFLSPYTLRLTTDNETIKAQRLAAKERGVRLRYITEITQENLQECKTVLGMVTELRHLENIAGNFIISDSEIGVAPVISSEYPITYGYYSTLEGVLSFYRGVFETFWHYSIPAETKISQLEQGLQVERRPPPSTINDRKLKETIDRFYFCKQCSWTSIFQEESLKHQLSTGHNKIKEFPIFGL